MVIQQEPRVLSAETPRQQGHWRPHARSMCFQESCFNDLRNSSALLGTLSGVDTSCVINKLSKQGVRPCSKQHTPSSHCHLVLPRQLPQQHPSASLGRVSKPGQVPLQLPAQPVQVLPRDCRLPGPTQEVQFPEPEVLGQLPSL